MPYPSDDDDDSPKSHSPITALTSTSPAARIPHPPPDFEPQSDFDLNGFLNTESPSLLNETWFLPTSYATLNTDLKLGLPCLEGSKPHEKVDQLTPKKRPFSGKSHDASFSVQDPSRTDFSASSGSKGKAVLLPEHNLIKRALDSVNLEDHDDDDDEETRSGECDKRVRKEFRDNDEKSLPFDLNVDLNVDFENETQDTAANDGVPIEDVNIFNDCVLRLASFAREKEEGKMQNGIATVNLNEEPIWDDNGDGVGVRKFSIEEKGKGVLLENIHEYDLESGSGTGSESESESESSESESEMRVEERDRRLAHFREAAKSSAASFAYYKSDKKDGQASSSTKANLDIEQWSGPFSTAITAIRSRGMKDGHRGCNKSESLPASINWVPRSNQEKISARLSPPSLKELCIDVLANNADAIVSLEYVPDFLKHKLCQLVCNSRKINTHFLELLFSGSPTEIRIPDCSWITEEQFTKTFQSCDTTNLEVLQLGLCGRFTADYVVPDTFARSPNQLPRLISLSLGGACRLSDKGLRGLIPCISAIRSINLSQCSLLTSASVSALADSFGSRLKELYLDDCDCIDAELIGPELKKLEHLEVLSVAGIETVSDNFIQNFVIERGHNLKELVLKDCQHLTDSSIKIIAEYCPGLCSLDLTNLCKLTDYSIGYLVNGCPALRTLKLRRNPFSDEAIAAFLETTGMNLEELSLNNVKEVGPHTALSLACKAKRLHSLDLSWCRNLTDGQLGFIVDSCLSLRLLKIFGCSQITEVFLHGHSNREVEIIGMQLSPLLQHVKVNDEFERLGALRYSSATSPDEIY